MGWLALAAVAAALVWFYFKKAGQRYELLWRPEHLLEVARLLDKLNRDARADPDGAGLALKSEKTSAGYCLAYSVRDEEDGQCHHISMSHEGGWFAQGAASFLVAYFHALLRLGDIAVAAAVSTNGVYHIQFTIPPGEQTAGSVQLPTEADLQELVPACMALRSQIRFGQLEVPPRG